MDKGKYGFSGRKPRPASFSSLPGDSPPASSASPDTISAPEKLRGTFQRAKIGAGEEEDDGGVAWHLPPGLPRPVPLGRGWRPPRTMTMSSADFLPLESVFALVHQGYGGPSPRGMNTSKFIIRDPPAPVKKKRRRGPLGRSFSAPAAQKAFFPKKTGAARKMFTLFQKEIG